MSMLSMSITKLPTELVTEICHYLELSDWSAVRLTCNSLFVKSREAFADRYSKSVCLLLTKSSLRQLEALAENAYLRLRVKELWIVTTAFECYREMNYKEFCRSAFGAGSRRPYGSTDRESQDRHAAWQAIISDRDNILETDHLKSTLTKCMAEFENLTDVGLRTLPISHLLRPLKDMGIRCLGLRTLRDQLPCESISGVDTNRKTEVLLDIMLGLVFSQLLKALIECNRPSIQGLLYICNACDNDRCGIAPEDIVLGKSQYEILLPRLRNLQHLQLRLHNVRLQIEEAEYQFLSLLDLLAAAAPNLKTLGLSQAAQERTSKALELHCTAFSQYMAQNPISFAQLTKLDLCQIDITANTLKTFLRSAAPTLKSLTLKFVSLNDNLPSFPQPEKVDFTNLQWSAEAQDEIRQIWQSLWDLFRDELLFLQVLQMNFLCYRDQAIQIHDPFKKSIRPPVRPCCFASYDAALDEVSFTEWIDALEIIPLRRRRSIRYQRMR